MKPEKAKNLRELTEGELKQKLNDYRQDLYKMRFDAKSGRIEKPDNIKISRRNIAKILTVLREKSNAQQ